MPLPPDFDPDAPAADSDGLFGLPLAPTEAAVVVIPVPFEATTSFGRGTAAAPRRVLTASHQVDLNDVDTGEPWRKGVAMLDFEPQVDAWNEEACAIALPIIEAGGVHTDAHRAARDRVDAIGDQVNTWVHDHAAAILARGAIPAVVGGDHSVPFGAIQAAVEHHPGMGLLHIDAHADAREAFEGFKWSHASIIWNLRTRLRALGHVVSVGLRDVGREEDRLIKIWDDLTAYSDSELRYEKAAGEPWLRIAARIVYPLPKKIWVSVDVDGLEPQNCPHTGTPVPGGLTWGELLLLLQVLSQKHEIIGFDVCEVGDHPWDANVGARLLYKLAGYSLLSRS
ncbi:MAG: agmatinase [Myxococcota bacterium]|jgi:agmatinase